MKQDVSMVCVRSTRFPHQMREKQNEQTEVEFARSVNVATCKRRTYLPTQSSFDRLTEMILYGNVISESAYFSPEHICVSYFNPIAYQERSLLIEQLGKE